MSFAAQSGVSRRVIRTARAAFSNMDFTVGLVIHEAQSIPERGQVFQFHGARFEVVERRRNQITKLQVSVSPDDVAAG